MVIWKYILENPEGKFMMPKGAQILSCQVQGRNPCIWALVNKKAKKEMRHFVFFGTGTEIDIPIEKLRFIDTFQMDHGLFIFHVFEVLK